MHMADALISPAVGVTMWAVSGTALAGCSRKIKHSQDDKILPLMGVMGAFIFAAQMINFTIPGTGSSGHLSGGLLLAVLLGPHAAFLVLASVLTVQALFFADGGLLALGCNMFNLGFFPIFIAYPLIYRRITGNSTKPGRVTAASVAAAIVGLQLGSLFVVLETAFSGFSELPFLSFTATMQPIHLAIGTAEGLISALVINFIYRTEPALIYHTNGPVSRWRLKKILTVLVPVFFALAALSWFASKNPDGLEWAVSRVTGKSEMENPQGAAHSLLGQLQIKSSFLPDYDFRTEPEKQSRQGEGESVINKGKSLSAVLGGILTLAFIFFSGIILKRTKKDNL